MAPVAEENSDEGFYALLKPIQDITRKWNMDLSLNIEEYLAHICRVCGDNISLMNFAQAAMLVQYSADVYSTKVDVLFDTVMGLLQSICKKHWVTFGSKDRMSRGRNRDNGDEEGGPGHPAGKRRRPPPTLDTDEFVMFEEVCSERSLTVSIEKEKQKNLERKKNSIVLNAATKVKAKEKTSCYVLNHANDVLGKKEEFRLNWRICSAGTLHEEFIVSKNMFKRMEPLEITIWENGVENGIEDDASDHNFDVDYSHQNGDIQHEEEPPLVVNDLFSTALPEIESPQEEEFANPENRTRKEPNNLIDCKEIEWQPNDFSENLVEKPLKKKKVTKLPKRLEDENKRKSIYDTTTFTITDVFFTRLLNGTTKFLVDKDFIWQSNKVSKDKKELFKNLEHSNKDHPGFDYDDEPGFEGFNDMSDAEDDEDVGCAPEIDVPLPEGGNILDPPEENWIGDDVNTYDNEAKKTIEEFRSRKKKHGEKESQLAKRVEEWHKRILPKLEEAELRSSFDINTYGTKVLNSFSEGIGSEKLFQEIVSGQPREEVSRIFLASLMLANQYNVEISETEPGDLNKDCVQLKLLSLVRHHEELDDNMRQTSDK